MQIQQRDKFLAGEGDKWFERNANRGIVACDDPVVAGLRAVRFAPTSIVEIGCGAGQRVAALAATYGCHAWGFDPSSAAIERARADRPGVSFAVGTAERLALPDASVDLIVFGFCLYLTDPTDYFRIAMEADRVLSDRGLVCILDFLSPKPFRNRYEHAENLYSHKMEFARLFTWHPAYRLIARHYWEHDTCFGYDENESLSADFLRKDVAHAFPFRPDY